MCSTAVGFPTPDPITSTGVVFRDSFAAASLNQSKWTTSIGAGGSISQSAGTLTLGSGTTAAAETWLLSNQTFQLPCKVAVGLSLSQRIANQTFFVELVSVDSVTGVPDGQEQAALVFDGTTATQAKHQATTGGLTPNTSAASSYATTATPSLFEIEATPDEVWFHSTSGIDVVTARTTSYRLQLKAPDANRVYKLRLRWLNGTTPASSTNALITLLSAIEYQEISAEVSGTRGTTAAAYGFSINNTPSFNLLPATTTVGSAAHLAINSTATTNATNTKATAANIYEISLVNTSSSPKHFKLYNKASAPAVGTDVPIFIITIPANSEKSYEFGPFGKRLSLGFSWAITGAQAVSDATAVGAGEVIGSITYV